MVGMLVGTLLPSKMMLPCCRAAVLPCCEAVRSQLLLTVSGSGCKPRYAEGVSWGLFARGRAGVGVGFGEETLERELVQCVEGWHGSFVSMAGERVPV